MKHENKIERVKSFLFDSELKKSLDKISKKFNQINVLEITGMGNQEIKHSNLLSWLFEDQDHDLGNKVLFDFLTLVYKENHSLLEYILLRKDGTINIYREREDIDILIEDVANSRIFVIENKVHSSESKGQLLKYEEIARRLYPSVDCKIEYIYLSKANSPSPSRINWTVANYDMIGEVLTDILKNDLHIKKEVRFAIESYVELLKKNKIMKNKELENLCEKIWMNKEYREALNILLENKPKIDERLLKIGEKYGTPLTLIREYTPPNGEKEAHEVILNADGLLYFDGISYATPNTLINNGIKLKVNGVKGHSGNDSLNQLRIKNTGEKLSDKEFPKNIRK